MLENAASPRRPADLVNAALLPSIAKLYLHGVNMEKVGLSPTATIVNEHGNHEEVLVVRKRAPRTLFTMGSTQTLLSMSHMPHYIRQGRAEDIVEDTQTADITGRVFDRPRARVLDKETLST